MKTSNDNKIENGKKPFHKKPRVGKPSKLLTSTEKSSTAANQNDHICPKD